MNLTALFSLWYHWLWCRYLEASLRNQLIHGAMIDATDFIDLGKHQIGLQIAKTELGKS